MEICRIDIESNDRNCSRARSNLSRMRPVHPHPSPPFHPTAMKTRRLRAKNPVSPSKTKDLRAPSSRLSPITKQIERNRVTSSQSCNTQVDAAVGSWAFVHGLAVKATSQTLRKGALTLVSVYLSRATTKSGSHTSARLYSESARDASACRDCLA